MSTSTTIEHVRPRTTGLGRTRLLGIVGATLAAVAVWAIEVPVVGIHLATQFGAAAPQSVGIDAVVVSALVGSLAGWGLLAILEWRTARARNIWTVVALAVLLASLTLPLTAGTTTSAKVGLALMHLAVGGVLVPTLRRV